MPIVKVGGDATRFVAHYMAEIKKLFPTSDPCLGWGATKGRNGDGEPQCSELEELTPVVLSTQPRLRCGTYVVWAEPHKPEHTRDTWKNYNRPYMAYFHINQMWGLCGMAVAHNSYVGASYKKQGLGKLLGQMKADMAAHMGYGSLIMSNREAGSDAPIHRKIARKVGFRDIYKFRNPRTSSNINIMVIDLVDNPHGNAQGKEITL